MNSPHRCCANAESYLHPPCRVSDMSTSAGEGSLSARLNEWYLIVEERFIAVHYCPWCGLQLPRAAVDTGDTTDHGLALET